MYSSNVLYPLVSKHLSLILILIISFSGILINLIKRKSQLSGGHKNDTTLVWFRIAYPGAIISAYILEQLAWTAYHKKEVLVSGIILFVLGISIRWISVLALGKYFTVAIGIDNNHRLIKTGLYKWIRHPSYTGLLLYYAGLGLAMQNILSLIILMLATSSIVLWRIEKEEEMLESHFGDEWIKYSRKSQKLIPFLY